MLQTAKMIDTSTVKCNSSSPNLANQCQDCTEKSNHKHLYHHTEPTDQKSIQEAGFPKVQTLRPRAAAHYSKMLANFPWALFLAHIYVVLPNRILLAAEKSISQGNFDLG
jgi:hypothetical protein